MELTQVVFEFKVCTVRELNTDKGTMLKQILPVAEPTCYFADLITVLLGPFLIKPGQFDLISSVKKQFVEVTDL